ncbi:hypothetical protein RclHR1_01870002 [Rhizophagus clarus]|uniref:S-adenosyl-L-methionine-dependent methyltransferase n=1 Tax=Rhizophagus clarus TaxID=94130 RepID=A0A2Z6QMT7_9GLOM|nr:hypothetical protein RclHR1_01870002 [Rhizophagus clarus]GES83803.1 S-adenosyl-L-methionine-dependent methyltransferase [Rhizophagus clarus]
MGNVISNLKFSKKRTQKSKKPQQTKQLEQPEESRELEYYLSNYSTSDIDRQHLNHFFKKHIFQNNFSAPIEERLIQGGCKVLDAGCGPGTWLLDLATKYRNSSFFGVDIKPIYPSHIKPNNLEFSEADVLGNLPFPNNEFDFVHLEGMALIIKADEWPHVISELVRVTKSGGYIEIVEYISPDKNGPMMSELYNIQTEIGTKRGMDLALTPHLDEVILLQPHITEVGKDKRTFVIGPNGGSTGSTILDIILTFITSNMAIENISKFQGITKEEYMKKLDKLNEELTNTRPELSICRFWAKKN